MGLITTFALIVFAGNISYLFTYSPTSAGLHEPLIIFFQIIGISFIFIPIGMASTFLFQGLGKGTTSLILTFSREIIGSVLMPIIMATVFGFGVIGIWWGHPIGYLIATVIAYVLASKTITDLIKGVIWAIKKFKQKSQNQTLIINKIIVFFKVSSFKLKNTLYAVNFIKIPWFIKNRVMMKYEKVKKLHKILHH